MCPMNNKPRYLDKGIYILLRLRKKTGHIEYHERCRSSRYQILIYGGLIMILFKMFMVYTYSYLYF